MNRSKGTYLQGVIDAEQLAKDSLGFDESKVIRILENSLTSLEIYYDGYDYIEGFRHYIEYFKTYLELIKEN